MRRLPLAALVSVSALLLSFPAGAQAQRWRSGPSQPTPLTTERVIQGLTRPVWVGAAYPGDDRLFVLEKGGTIRLWKNGLLSDFLQISVSNGSEQGLLGLAFHPDHQNNRLFYVNYTRPDGDTVISEWQHKPGAPDVGDSNSERILIVQSQPFANHNGGDLHFGLDGYLYIGFGDGGAGNDPFCNGQDLTTFLGKMLRIDVDGGVPYGIPAGNPYVGHPTALEEIWFSGLRNPWRFCVDAATGDLYMGDVGQNAREEVSFGLAGVGGTNYGWPEVEANICNPSASCPGGTPACGSLAYQKPVVHYLNEPGRAVTGGRVYRGAAIPDLQGHYFYADHGAGFIVSFIYDPGSQKVHELKNRRQELAPGGGLDIITISAFGEDGYGELYVVDRFDGEVFKIVPR